MLYTSFTLMRPDKIDDRLFPNAVAIQPFETKGTQEGDEEPRPVWERIVDSWKGQENRSVYIEGEGGIGKTVTLLSPPAELPTPALYIQLYKLVRDGKCLSVTDWLHTNMLGYAEAIDRLAMKEWKNGPSMLLLLDGINEIPALQRSSVLNQLISWRETHPGAQLIAVTRPLDEYYLLRKLSDPIHIRLESLSEETVLAYLCECGLDAPTEGIPKDSVLRRPLFLTLYAKTGRITHTEAEGYPLAFLKARSKGAIIWNYLQRELLRFPEEGWVLHCAVACEYILPLLAHDMLERYEFEIRQDRALKLIQDASDSFDPRRLPKHLSVAWQTHFDLRYEYPNLRAVDWNVLIFKDLGLLLPKGEGKEKVYTFPHQIFRDCLAGLHLVNQAEAAEYGLFPASWMCSQSHLALDYAAELLDPEVFTEKLWEPNRLAQSWLCGVKNHTATCNLLELCRRNNKLPRELDFSGMDLSGLSLVRYLGKGETLLPLFRNSTLSKGTRLDRSVFESEGHTGPIKVLAILPGGRVVSGSDDHTLRVWDTATGQCLQTMKGHNGSVICLIVLPDERVVSGSDDHILRVWDTTTGQCQKTMNRHSNRVNCLAVLPDGRVVSGSNDHTLRVWDTTTGQCQKTMNRHSNRVNCLAVLPDGRVVSGSDDHTLRVWDTDTGRCLQTLEGHSGAINCLAVLSDGRVVSGSDDHTLRVWDTDTGQCLQTLEGHSGAINCLAVLSDGRVVSGSDDHTLRVWDTDTGQCLQTLEGHSNRVNCLAVLPDGRVVSGAWDNTLRVWSTDTGRCLQTLEGQSGAINCVTVLPDGRIISGSADKTLQMWDAAIGQCLQTLEGHNGRVICVAVLKDIRGNSRTSNNSLVLSSSGDSTLRVWDVNTSRCLQTLVSHSNQVDDCLVVLSDGRIISGSADKTLQVWDTDTGHCLQTLEWHSNSVNYVAILPDGRGVSGAADKTLRVWDVNTCRCLKTLKGHTGFVTCIAVLSDGRIVSGSDDETLRVWNPDSGDCMDIWYTMEVDVSGMDFSDAEIKPELAHMLQQNGATISNAQLDKKHS